MKILDRRMKDVKIVKPDMIVTGCTGCLLQFAEGISRSGLSRKIEVCHPPVLVEKAIATCPIPTHCRKDLPVFQALHTDAGQWRNGCLTDTNPGKWCRHGHSAQSSRTYLLGALNRQSFFS
jgi:hypothetical protein